MDGSTGASVGVEVQEGRSPRRGEIPWLSDWNLFSIERDTVASDEVRQSLPRKLIIAVV